MQSYDHLTSVQNARAHTATPPETVSYFVGRDRLLEDGKWLLSEHIAGPFDEVGCAQEALAACGDRSAHIVQATTFGRVIQVAVACTYLRKDFHGFEIDMPDGTSQLLSADEVLQAPWYGTLPADERERIEHMAAHWKRHGWDA